MESELKLELDVSAYDALLALAGSADTVEQINTFYDTVGRELRARGVALRLRREGARAWLTAKGGAIRQQAGYFVRPENEQELAAGVAGRLARGFTLSECPPGVVHELLEGCGDLAVTPVCAFVNYRTRVRHGGWTFDLDRTIIGGLVLHELEMEGRSESEGLALQDWLLGRGLGFRPAVRSKLSAAMSVAATGRPGP